MEVGGPSVRGGAGQDLTPGSGTSDFSCYARCPWALGVPSLQQAYSEKAKALSAGTTLLLLVLRHHAPHVLFLCKLIPGPHGLCTQEEDVSPGLARALLPADLTPHEPPIPCTPHHAQRRGQRPQPRPRWLQPSSHACSPSGTSVSLLTFCFTSGSRQAVCGLGMEVVYNITHPKIRP